MHKMLFVPLLCLVVCAVDGANRVWTVAMTNDGPSSVTLSALNTTCWNMGNFSKTPTDIGPWGVEAFSSSEDQSSASCKGASVRELFFVWNDGDFWAIIRFQDQGGSSCSVGVFAKGQPDQVHPIDCAQTRIITMTYHGQFIINWPFELPPKIMVDYEDGSEAIADAD